MHLTDWAIILRKKLINLSLQELTSKSSLSIKQLFHEAIIMASNNELPLAQKNTICNHAELSHSIQEITDFNQESNLFPNIVRSQEIKELNKQNLGHRIAAEALFELIKKVNNGPYLTKTPILRDYAISAFESVKKHYHEQGTLPITSSPLKINHLKQPILDLQAELNQYKLSGNPADTAQSFFYKRSARKISAARQQRIQYLEALITAYQAMIRPYEVKDILTPDELAQFQSDHEAFMAAFIAIKDKHDRSNSSWIHNFGNRNRLGKLLNCVFTPNMTKKIKRHHKKNPPHFSITASSIVLDTLNNSGLLMNKTGYKTAITKHIASKQFIPNVQKELSTCTTAKDITNLKAKTDKVRRLLQASGSITQKERDDLKKTAAKIVNSALDNLRAAKVTVDPIVPTQPITRNAHLPSRPVIKIIPASRQPSAELPSDDQTHNVQATQQSLPTKSVELSKPDTHPQIVTFVKTVIQESVTELSMEAAQSTTEGQTPPTTEFIDTPPPTPLIDREQRLKQMQQLRQPSEHITKLRTASFSARLLPPPKIPRRSYHSELNLSSASSNLTPLAPNA